MGAELSAIRNANRAQAVKNSQVLEFHSSTEWKAHFESSKETSKLVTLFYFFSQIVFIYIMMHETDFTCHKTFLNMAY